MPAAWRPNLSGQQRGNVGFALTLRHAHVSDGTLTARKFSDRRDPAERVALTATVTTVGAAAL